MTADRPPTEPRTEAGRTMRTLLMDMYTAWAFIIDANGIEVDEMPDDPLPLILAIEAEAAQGAAPLRLLERFAPIMADHPLWVERRVCNAPGCGDEDYFDHIRAIERGYPMNDFSGDDLDRAIAIVEDSRQTHVNWAEWRRKGNGTDTDHEMIGDLEWHENAIRDYDHVLSVLRAAPRAEGLDVDQFREWVIGIVSGYPMDDGEPLGLGGRAFEQCRMRVLDLLDEWQSRPSDERVPESEEPR